MLLIVPLAIAITGALIAAAAGHKSVNRVLTVKSLSGLLGALTFSIFLLFLFQLTPAALETPLSYQIEWMPSAGIQMSLYFDALTALFALLVSGIGVLVVLYSGPYFAKSDQEAGQRTWGEWRFFSYLFVFMFAMLGLVMAGDLITLFLFWEATSISSFLLIAYKFKDESARKGAFKSLLITGAGGLALLIGILLIGNLVGGYDYQTLLTSGDLLRGSALYPLLLVLISVGAFTKSAQFPAHIWLPQAMSAPTPASAYLHSATMVKAGIYLMARLNPALGFTTLWFWLLSLVGLATMLAGAYLGVKQRDLKALLAYSTISQLGALMMLIGQDTEVAFKALVIGVLAHGLYKSALFMTVGNVDHEAGTRDLKRLGGLRRAMPATFLISGVAALSMGGLPPLFGFLAKETLLATATHPNVPQQVEFFFPLAIVISGALLLLQASLLIWETFLGERSDESVTAHEAPLVMLLAPAIPAAFSLALGLLPEPRPLAHLLAESAAAVFSSPVKVSLALWTGINVPLVLSIIAVGSGAVLFLLRDQARAAQNRLPERLSFNSLYAGTLRLIDVCADQFTRVQSGKLRRYLTTILLSMLALVAGGLVVSGVAPDMTFSMPTFDFRGEVAVLRIFTMLLVVGASVATVFLRRDLSAIVALGVTGMAIALLMVLEPAPDVALVQVVVDILAVVILTLALTRIPRKQRQAAQIYHDDEASGGTRRDALIAGIAGVFAAGLTLVALTTRPRFTAATPFYEANAKVLTGAKDIVGAIVVDFRAFDTLIEIAVFSLAGLGIYALLRYAAKHPVDPGWADEDEAGDPDWLNTRGIGGQETSSFLHALAYLSLPISMVIGIVHILYGHDQPGDGFTAGVIISLAIGFWYIIFGFEGVKQRLSWLRPHRLIGAGLLLALATASSAHFLAGTFFGHVDYGSLLGIQLPRGVNFSSSLLFEFSIALAVLGSASLIIDTLGHPQDEPHEEIAGSEAA